MNSKTFKTLSLAGVAMMAVSCGDAAGQPSPDAAKPQAAKQYDAPPPMTIDAAKDYSAKIVTNLGSFTVDLFEADAPVTVNNFVFLAGEDFYDGVIFHRVIDRFMIQGGDPTGTGMGGPGYQFQDETRGNKQQHEPFTLSMANSGPNTNGSQFFVTEVATGHLDGRHTVFGRVTEGKDIVEKISDVRVGRGDKPVEDVVMQDVIIMVDGEPMNGGKPTTQPS